MKSEMSAAECVWILKSFTLKKLIYLICKSMQYADGIILDCVGVYWWSDERENSVLVRGFWPNEGMPRSHQYRWGRRVLPQLIRYPV